MGAHLRGDEHLYHAGKEQNDNQTKKPNPNLSSFSPEEGPEKKA